MEGTKKRILVIDDEPDIVMMIKSRLEAHGFDVVSAPDAEDGLEKIKRDKPDLIVLDLILPGMNGYELCARLKFDHIFDGPIIMLTARIRGIDLQLGYRCGANAYIPKPFFSERLLDEVHKLLNTSETVK